MKRLYIHILLIVLFSTLFTTFITQIPNPIFTNIGSKDSWINFFGAITGGFLTLYGVWWTIKNQENQRKTDLSIQYRPILSIDGVSQYDKKPLEIIEKNNQTTFQIYIVNVGRGRSN